MKHHLGMVFLKQCFGNNILETVCTHVLKRLNKTTLYIVKNKELIQGNISNLILNIRCNSLKTISRVEIVEELRR